MSKPIRRQSSQRGAIVMVVAMSLSLLAVVGLYAFSNAQRSVRGAGALRSMAQGRGVAEHAIQATAELVNPASAAFLDRRMVLYANANIGSGEAVSECASVPRPSSGDPNLVPSLGKRCFKQDQTYLGKYIKDSLGGASNAPLDNSLDSAQDAKGTYTIELSDPTNFYVGVAGASVTRRQCVRRYTATVRALISPNDIGGVAQKPNSRVGARGRITTGPLECGS